MNTFLKDIKEFHEKFAQAYDGPPRALPEDLLRFRDKFLREEHKELRYSNRMNNLPELLDAFVDYAYVLFGTVYLAGMFPVFEQAWADVHAKNMQKERAHRDNPGKRGFVEFDIVKPPGWTPPDHTHLIEAATVNNLETANYVPRPFPVGFIGDAE
jgi:predicted HAD superfamily Cof-like phosphohydrolase